MDDDAIASSLILRDTDMRSKICQFIREIPLLYKLAYLSNILLLIWCFRDLFSYFFPNVSLLASLLVLPFLIFYTTTLIWSALHTILHFKQIGIKSFLPFLIHTLMLGLLFNVNFTQVWLSLNFDIFLHSREDVVALVRSGQLISGSYGRTELPRQYLWTSCDGTIDVDKSTETMEILFCTFSGFDSVAGYVYSDRSPDLHHFSRGKILEFQKLREHWFWLSTT
ncbi:hypothetical protein Pse7429DRAFT_2932 [Pseudanabaena biceps PCC 7429]|uniref:Uncharacterized protein n=1 Tax=Pseudanabaena biceps PCC 7429 TaxID=927668 RepID=L8N0K3_9CYAN|nr:hypothetical protein Pse7429DRAFT_2932 [Pseudanabaena biceps PCC 7429]